MNDAQNDIEWQLRSMQAGRMPAENINQVYVAEMVE
jgi:hypothetical protein